MSESIESMSIQRVLDGSRAVDTATTQTQRKQTNQVLENRSTDRAQASLNKGTESVAKKDQVDQLANLKALGNVKLSISIDDTKQLPIIKIFDDETGKELIQIPAEHALNISRTIKAAVGAIFDTKA
jgi:uncharacterized FlaG/YvyC family protein